MQGYRGYRNPGTPNAYCIKITYGARKCTFFDASDFYDYTKKCLYFALRASLLTGMTELNGFPSSLLTVPESLEISCSAAIKISVQILLQNCPLP